MCDFVRHEVFCFIAMGIKEVMIGYILAPESDSVLFLGHSGFRLLNTVFIKV